MRFTAPWFGRRFVHPSRSSAARVRGFVAGPHRGPQGRTGGDPRTYAVGAVRTLVRTQMGGQTRVLRRFALRFALLPARGRGRVMGFGAGPHGGPHRYGARVPRRLPPKRPRNWFALRLVRSEVSAPTAYLKRVCFRWPASSAKIGGARRRFAPDMARESLAHVQRAREGAQTCANSYIRRFAALLGAAQRQRCHSRKEAMRRILTVCLFFASSVGAQTMYKCQVDGKITYSGTPCFGGSEVKKIKADAAPTPEDQARAQERAQTDRERSQAQDQQAASERRDRRMAQGNESRSPADRARAESAARVANFRAQHGADAILGPTYNGVRPGQAALDQAAAEANAGVGQGAGDPNEKITTHDSSGWDRKTRGQIAAEEAAKRQARARARAGDEPAPSGARGAVEGWESEKVLSHDTSGWNQTTRAQAVQNEAAKEYKREKGRIAAEQAAKDSPTITSCDSGGCNGSNGTRFNGDPKGITFFASDGRTCQKLGSIMQCN
jgi:hypothetical protein